MVAPLKLLSDTSPLDLPMPTPDAPLFHHEQLGIFSHDESWLVEAQMQKSPPIKN